MRSDSAIRLEAVSKTYRLYHSLFWRAVAALGMPVPKRAVKEFRALREIDLNIAHASRVGVIGRNGAGKSTLLRIIAGQTPATTGQVCVSGSVQALMELGTGFHPDFTGIQNIRSALAYQGVIGRDANARVEEIIDFTELDEFIQRPVREYSAGMYTRLAFAVATSIKPDILIIDEILGAGDAYFVGKSIQRIRNLTQDGATVLFVSHDMSAVQMLCERAVWLERGHVRMAGDALTVGKAYLAQVREDEEARQRARTMALSRQSAARLPEAGASVLVRLINEAGKAPKKPLHVASARLRTNDTVLASVEADETPANGSRFLVEKNFTNWGEIARVGGRPARPFKDLGGKYIHAPLVICLPGPPPPEARLELEWYAEVDEPVAVEAFVESESRYERLGVLHRNGHNGWQSSAFSLPPACTDTWEQPPEKGVSKAEKANLSDLVVLTKNDQYGTGQARILAFAFLDQVEERRHTLITGEPASAALLFETQGKLLDVTAVIAIYRPDGICALQAVSRRDGIEIGPVSGRHRITVHFEPMLLGPGDYITSVALFKDLELSNEHEPTAYDLHDRCYTLKVLAPFGINVSFGIVNHPVRWTIERS